MPKKWLILAAAIILPTGIIALGLFLPHTQLHPTISLPSGSTFTLAEARFSKSRFILPNTTWQRKLAFLPDSLLKFLKINPGQVFLMQSNEFVIWLYVAPPGASDLFNTSANPISIVDENGAECTGPNFLPYTFPSYTPKVPSLIGLGLSAFPRRAREFRLRIYSKDSDRKLLLLGEMKIPNPAYRNYPNWPPEPLPITKTNGDVVITLTKILVGTSMFSPEPGATNEEPWGQAAFTFTRGGKPTRDWAVDNIDFSDATGNHTAPPAWGDDQPKPGQEVFRFRVPLWPAESAWKLNVTLRRRPGAKFAPGELWSVTNVPLPALYSTNVLGLHTNLSGIGLVLQSIVDETGMLPDETHGNYHRVRLIFQVPPLPPNLRFDVLSVTGHEASTNAHPRNLKAALGGTVGNSEFFYLVPATAQTLDLKLGVYRQLTAEFVVKPTTVQSTSNAH